MGGVHYAETEEEAIGHAMQQGERRKQFEERMGKLTFEIEEFNPKPIERTLLKHD
jgi:hypothetical protein